MVIHPVKTYYSLSFVLPFFRPVVGEKWLVPSRPLVNPLEERLPESSWRPRQQGRVRPLLAV